MYQKGLRSTLFCAVLVLVLQVIFVGVLKGAYIVMTDLTRHLNFPHTVRPLLNAIEALSDSHVNMRLLGSGLRCGRYGVSSTVGVEVFAAP
jgi:hypothetical protein